MRRIRNYAVTLALGPMLALSLAATPLVLIDGGSHLAFSKDGGSGSGGEHSGGDHSGGDHSGRDGGDHSGPGRGDDGAGHEVDNDRTAGIDREDEHLNPANGAKVEVDGDNIEVVFANGIKEEIENGRYEKKDAAGNTVIQRVATSADVARLKALAN